MADTHAGGGIEGRGEQVVLLDVEVGEGEVETVAEQRALEADLELAAFLQGEVGVGRGEADELGDGLRGGAGGGVGVEGFGGGPDEARAAGPRAIAFLEGRERGGRGGGGVEQSVALEGDVIVAQTADEFQGGREFENVFREEGVGADDDAGGFLLAGDGAAADVGVEEGDAREDGGDVAGRAAADLVVVLDAGADEKTVGEAEERAAEREVEAVAEENIVAVDVDKRGTGDEAGEGVPGVGLEVAPLEDLSGGVGLVAQFEVGGEGELGAETVEGVFGVGVVIEDVVVGAAGGGIDAGVDEAVGGAVEKADLGLGTGDRGVDDGVVDDGVAVVALDGIGEPGGEVGERNAVAHAPTEGAGEAEIVLRVAVLVAAGGILDEVEAVGYGAER